jgi:hypothetical protein
MDGRYESHIGTRFAHPQIPLDHVGGLLADGVKDRLRPDLRVHVAAAEAEFWASPDFSRVSMGVLTACWVRAELGAAPDRGRKAGPGR